MVDLALELEKFGAEVLVQDPLAAPEQVKSEYGITLTGNEAGHGADAVVLVVPHAYYLQGQNGWEKIVSVLKMSLGLVADIPDFLNRETIPDGITLWRL